MTEELLNMNKSKKIIFLFWIVIVIGAISWNSFTEKPEQRIPFVPIVDVSINGKEMPPVYPVYPILSGDDIREELKEFDIPNTVIDNALLVDRKYQAMEHESMVRMIEYATDFYWNTPQLEFRSDFFDCDNYARLLVGFIDLAAIPQEENTLLKDIFQGQIAVFRIYVLQRSYFGGVPGSENGGHALIMFRSSEGWYVYEPQSGIFTDLVNYPNIKFIWRIIGD